MPDPAQPSEPAKIPPQPPVGPAPAAPAPSQTPSAAPEPAPKLIPSPRSGKVPPVASRFKKGNKQGGRPPNGGASVLEWFNILIAQELDEDKIRTLARNKKTPPAKRMAACRILRSYESGDLADYEPYLSGEKTLKELREAGFNTEVVKKAKVKTRTFTIGESEETVTERELELHDRDGHDFDRVMDRTIGRPKQAIDVNTHGLNLRTESERQDQADRILDRLRGGIAAGAGGAGAPGAVPQGSGD